MDNFHIDVTGDSDGMLKDCLYLCLAQNPFVTHWCDHPNKGLVLFWSKPTSTLRYEVDHGNGQVEVKSDLEVHPLPFTMKDADGIAVFVRGWLNQQPWERCGPKPDIDGSVGKGFRIYNDRWKHVDGCSNYSLVAIQPKWAEFHK